MPDGRVVAVVTTFNRRRLLADCLRALAAQTRPVAEVVVVDNASSDGTAELLRAGELGRGLALSHLRLPRNAGAAEGEHVGMAAALERGADWVWVMDDDCEPDPGCLDTLLTCVPAGDPATAALAPVVVSAAREPLALARGAIRPRWFLAPLVEPREREGDTPVDFATFVGPLVRASAVRAVGLPERRAFIRNEDVEFFARLRAVGRTWLVREAVLVHRDPRPFTDASLPARLRDYLRPDPLAQEWKHLYALRNLVFAGRRHGFLTAARALSYVLTQAVRRLAFGERRLRGAYLTALFGLHGWRGLFLNVAPERWPDLVRARRPGAWLRAHALRYDDDLGDLVARLVSTP